jgi:tetratricopeptide (TPR) repeat protein
VAGSAGWIEEAASIVVRASRATTEEERSSILAEGVLQFGFEFVDALEALSDQGEPYASLHDDVVYLLARWIRGDRLTSRADELERRVRAARWLLNSSGPGDEGAARFVANSIMALPEGHPDRDVDLARKVLLEALDLLHTNGAADQQLSVIETLLKLRLESTDELQALVDRGLALVDRAADPVVRRNFRLAVLDYNSLSAMELRGGGGWADDRTRIPPEHEEEFLRLKAQTQRMVKGVVAEDSPDPRVNAQNLAVAASHLDLFGDWREAADLYQSAQETGSLTEGAEQAAAEREAVMRLSFGEHSRVVELLQPLLPKLEERYLTAVLEDDIRSTGKDHGEAVANLGVAYAHLGNWGSALETLDRGKSLRLRYRAALRQTEEGQRVLALERELEAVVRGVAGAPGAEEPDDPFRVALGRETMLLQAYQDARPQLPRELLASPTIREIAESLADDEAVVVLGAGLEAMLAAVIVRGDNNVPTGRLLRTEWSWAWLAEKVIGDVSDGWFYAVGLPEEPIDRRGSLARLVETFDESVGRRLSELLSDAGARRAVIIPHRLLHLVPFWALPTLGRFDLLLAPSAAQFLRSRADPTPCVSGQALVVSDPTLDLPVSRAETAAVCAALSTLDLSVDEVTGSDATRERLAAALPQASLLHFSGHGRSEMLNPARSALLVHPSEQGDPFPAWMSAVSSTTTDDDDEEGPTYLEAIGNLSEEVDRATGRVERRLERESGGVLQGLYENGELRRLAELWLASEIAVQTGYSGLAIAFLSACQSGVSGAQDLDEYGGLPAALELAGVHTVVSTMWPVSESVAALFAALFYRELTAAGQGTIDVTAIVRSTRDRLSTMPRADALGTVAGLRRATDGIAARLTLDSFAADIRRRGDPPFTDAWELSAFYVSGQGSLTVGGANGQP